MSTAFRGFQLPGFGSPSPGLQMAQKTGFIMFFVISGDFFLNSFSYKELKFSQSGLNPDNIPQK
jgi:hypothetical protein